jgi:hypothetical protein
LRLARRPSSTFKVTKAFEADGLATVSVHRFAAGRCHHKKANRRLEEGVVVERHSPNCVGLRGNGNEGL